MKGKTSSYIDFYDYVTYYNLIDNTNVLYKKMSEDRENGKDNWSDFENTIAELTNDFTIEELEKCIDEFQNIFTEFLNELVDTNILLELNKDVSTRNLSIQSLSNFMNDVSELYFIKQLGHNHLFNFVFANFNYTSLLDNYIHLDKEQFDPHPYTISDRNLQLHCNSSKCNPKGWLSAYLLCDIIHPHGTQDIPRSILFGIDLPEYDKGKNDINRLVKSYWAQYDAKYKSYIDEAELFIIYGMSLGTTDAWWMDEIYDAIITRNVELIIYKYGNEDENDIKQMFIDVCVRHVDRDEEEKDIVKNNIHVVTFENNDTYFLGFENKDKDKD